MGLVDQLRRRAGERMLEQHVGERLARWHRWVADQPPRIAVRRPERYPVMWLERSISVDPVAVPVEVP